MPTFLSSRLRLILVPAVAAGTLVALAAGVNAATGDALTASLASATGACAARHATTGLRHPACSDPAAMQARAAKVKAPALRPRPAPLTMTKPAQSAGTPGDRALWRQIRSRLAPNV